MQGDALFEAPGMQGSGEKLDFVVSPKALAIVDIHFDGMQLYAFAANFPITAAGAVSK